MSWTDDRVEVLKKLWGEGRTAAEIAKELGDVTRNAVIGKAHRLKLSGRVSPIQQNNKKPANVSQAPRAVAAVEKKPAMPAPTVTEISEADAKREKISMMDLAAGACRWPIGDPKTKDFGFCGCESVSGLPYCAEHSKVAYQVASKSRTLRAEDLEKEAAARAEKMALNN